MIGSGGSAIVAKTLGEKKHDKANEYFSMLLFVALGAAIVLSVFGFFLIRPICILLGAQGQLLEYAVTYGRIMFISQPAYMMQTIFQTFFITAEKPIVQSALFPDIREHQCLLDLAAGGCLKITASLVLPLPTGIGERSVDIFHLFIFFERNPVSFEIVKPKFDLHVLARHVLNGAYFEFMTNVSSSVVNILYNHQLMRLAGEKRCVPPTEPLCIAQLYFRCHLSWIFHWGSAPVNSYNYGAGNHSELEEFSKKEPVSSCDHRYMSERSSQNLRHSR